MHAYIALGSNLDSPLEHILKAVDDIIDHHHIALLKCSHWYQSKAIGPGAQPDYINGVISIATQLSPLALLDHLQSIENAHGRVRTIRWGARTLDLDILLCDELLINSERLIIPHPRMTERAFVMTPLNDIAPTFTLSNGDSVGDNCQRLEQSGLRRLP